MGIISRFTDIMKSNINALLDKCEDPAKMIDQTLRDLREDLAEVKKEECGTDAVRLEPGLYVFFAFVRCRLFSVYDYCCRMNVLQWQKPRGIGAGDFT